MNFWWINYVDRLLINSDKMYYSIVEKWNIIIDISDISSAFVHFDIFSLYTPIDTHMHMCV